MPSMLRCIIIAAIFIHQVAGAQTVVQQLNTIIAEKASRTPAERKIDSQLLYLARERAGQAAVSGVPGLRSRVAVASDGLVVVDISATPSVELSQAITDAGGAVFYESPRWKSVRASLPPTALVSIAARADVEHVAKGAHPNAHTGPVTSEGDPAHNADTARSDFGVDGSGIKVGIISDSVDFYMDSISDGELPASFTILPGRDGIEAGSTGEGTAMSEIVHDLAPGAELFFASASGGKAFFADSILMLRAAGCDVIVDDISYPNECQFQDDEIGQAVNEVVEDGALYFSSSGNEGSLLKGTSTTWEGDFVDGGAAGDPLPFNGRVHSFGTQNFNTLTEGESDVEFQWSDEANTSANDYDLFVLNEAGTIIVTSSTDIQDGTQKPFESVGAVQPGEQVLIWKDDEAADRYLRIVATQSKLEFATAGQTIGHASTDKCITVAASDASLAAPGPFTTASLLEDSSSDGPRKMFYLPDGTPITPGNFLASGGLTLQKPDITAADGVSTSVPGFDPFFGTSAAAPHAAAIAALVWSQQPDLDNASIRSILETSTIDIEAPGREINSGFGILMADLALASAPTATPTDTAAPAPTATPTDTTAPAPTDTAAPAATPTGSVVATTTAEATATVTTDDTPTPVITQESTNTPTPVAAVCVGDCDGNGRIAISELVRGVNIALGNAALSLCTSLDSDNNGRIAINELVRAVRFALSGCPN